MTRAGLYRLRLLFLGGGLRHVERGTLRDMVAVCPVKLDRFQNLRPFESDDPCGHHEPGDAARLGTFQHPGLGNAQALRDFGG
jgi:hypothetical protein